MRLYSKKGLKQHYKIFSFKANFIGRVVKFVVLNTSVVTNLGTGRRSPSKC